LSTAFALAVPRMETEPIAPHPAFYQRVASVIRKRLADKRGRNGSGGRGGSEQRRDGLLRCAG
jgi:type I restriction enzyme R subunit